MYIYWTISHGLGIRFPCARLVSEDIRPFCPVLDMDMHICLCLCAEWGKMTPRFPAVNHSVATWSRWPIKNPWANAQWELCSEGPPRHSLPQLIHSFFTSHFLSIFCIMLSDRGLSTTHGHTYTWTHTKNTCTHARMNAVQLITLLLICRALIETPLSPSCTCISSLIFCQGAFGGRREGDGDGRRGLPSLLWSGKIKLSSYLVSAFSSNSEKNMPGAKRSGGGLPLPSASHPSVTMTMTGIRYMKISWTWSNCNSLIMKEIRVLLEIIFHFWCWHSNKCKYSKRQVATVCSMLL